jgi:hypothetical protein
LEMTSLSDLQKVAEAAQQGRYFEFDELLPSCSDAERKLAMRIALFPRLDHEDWNIYKDILLHGVDDEPLLALRDNNVFEEDYAYGHETRQVAARRWFLEHFPARIKNEASALMFSLACRVDSTEPSNWPFVRALIWFASLADEFKLDDVTRSLGIAAASLVSDVEVNTNLRLSAIRLCVQQQPRVAPLIAMGLLNHLGFAKRQNDLERRDALLEEIRRLQQAWPQDPAVRELLRTFEAT